MLREVSVLHCSVAMRESGPVVLSGEADARSAGQLRELPVWPLWPGGCRLVIDVSGLRHADSESVRVLVMAAKMLRERRGELVLLHPQAAVARMLDLMGADQAITLAQPPGTLTALASPG